MSGEPGPGGCATDEGFRFLQVEGFGVTAGKGLWRSRRVTISEGFLAPLSGLPGLKVDFIERIPGVCVDGEREDVLERLRPHHVERLRAGFGVDDWWKAEQVHGAGVALVGGSACSLGRCELLEGVDGLVTDRPGAVLGIYVADCGPIWLADRRSGAVGLLHSGRKGTEGNILKAGLEAMAESFGTQAKDVVAVLGPCIRPPHYEVDIAAEIGRQAELLGVGVFHDSGIDTAADLDRWYSYRMEKGRTGRMLALIMREGGA